MINMIGITLGITTALVIFNLAKYEWRFDSSFPLAKDTYRVVEQMKFQHGINYYNTTAYPLAEALREEFPQLLYVTQTHGPVTGVVSLKGISGNHVFKEDQLLFADPYFLQVFEPQWLYGNQKTALQDPQSVVLTKSLSNKYFPEALEHQQSVLGNTIKITVAGEFEEVFKVTGIVEDPPPNTTYRFNLLLPYSYFKLQDTFAVSNWSGNYQGTTFLTLAKDQNKKELEQLLVSFKGKYLSPEDDKRKTYFLQPLSEVHIDSVYGNAPGSYVLPKKYLLGMIALGLLILILAGANFVSLATAQALNRAREIGVRRAIGSTRRQLISQFLLETFLICLISGILALALSSRVLVDLNNVLAIIQLKLTFNSSMWLGALALVLALTILAGFYPALAASRLDPKGEFKTSLNSHLPGQMPLKKSLLVLQFTICQILLAATVIVVWQMNFLDDKDLGFTQEAIINVPIPEFDQGQLDSFKNSLIQSSYIQSVSYASCVPTAHDLELGTSFRLEGSEESQRQSAEMKVIDQEYLAIYDLELLVGKNVSLMREDGAFSGFVVNETLVHALGLSPAEALGKQLIINEGQAPIIGVVADFHNAYLKEKIGPCILFNWYPDFFWEAGIKITPGNSKLALQHIKETWEMFFPDSVYQSTFLTDYLKNMYALERLFLLFIKVATLLAIIIGCLGVYGLVTFSVAKRTKEMGIRKVLGATSQQILSLFTSDYVKMIALAFIIATPCTWWLMNNWLQGFNYRITLGPETFILTFITMLLVALGAITLRLWQVVGSNPVEALKNE